MLIHDLHKDGFYVINGILLKRILKKPDVGFWKMHGLTKDDHRLFLQMSQKYFEDLMTGETTLDDKKYFVIAPQEFLDAEVASHIIRIGEYKDRANAHVAFVEKPVCVKQAGNRFIFTGNDGRHRYITAQKNKLNLLVKVISN